MELFVEFEVELKEICLQIFLIKKQCDVQVLLQPQILLQNLLLYRLAKHIGILVYDQNEFRYIESAFGIIVFLYVNFN